MVPIENSAPLEPSGIANLAALNDAMRAMPPLVPGATQAVLGEGPEGAAIAFVGEQPGDQEDREGRPFVGPAGQLLDRALKQAGISRERVYITNAVKHFKFLPRGKRRIHQKPTAGEVRHYRGWLWKELSFVKPNVVVALGATAVLALAGKAIPIGQARGEIVFDHHPGYITVHPSSLLRIPDEDGRKRAFDAFVADMARVKLLSSRTSYDRDVAGSLAGG